MHPRTWITKEQLVIAFNEWLRLYDAKALPEIEGNSYGELSAGMLLYLLAQQNRGGNGV
jgi:hypothetical protein